MKPGHIYLELKQNIRSVKERPGDPVALAFLVADLYRAKLKIDWDVWEKEYWDMEAQIRSLYAEGQIIAEEKGQWRGLATLRDAMWPGIGWPCIPLREMEATEVGPGCSEEEIERYLHDRFTIGCIIDWLHDFGFIMGQHKEDLRKLDLEVCRNLRYWPVTADWLDDWRCMWGIDESCGGASAFIRVYIQEMPVRTLDLVEEYALVGAAFSNTEEE